MARLVLLVALVLVAIVAVSSAAAKRRRVVIIVIRRRPRDVSDKMEWQNRDHLPRVATSDDHPLEHSRFAREAGDEPLWLYKDDNIDRAPATGDHPYIPSYIDDVKLNPNRRFARDIHDPEVLYVMEPLMEDDVQE